MSDTKSLNEAVRGIRKRNRIVKKSLAGIDREFNFGGKEQKALTTEETGLSTAFKEAEKPKREKIVEEEKPKKRKPRVKKEIEAPKEPRVTRYRVRKNTMTMIL